MKFKSHIRFCASKPFAIILMSDVVNGCWEWDPSDRISRKRLRLGSAPEPDSSDGAQDPRLPYRRSRCSIAFVSIEHSAFIIFVIIHFIHCGNSISRRSQQTNEEKICCLTTGRVCSFHVRLWYEMDLTITILKISNSPLFVLWNLMTFYCLEYFLNSDKTISSVI